MKYNERILTYPKLATPRRRAQYWLDVMKRRWSDAKHGFYKIAGFRLTQTIRNALTLLSLPLAEEEKQYVASIIQLAKDALKQREFEKFQDRCAFKEEQRCTLADKRCGKESCPLLM